LDEALSTAYPFAWDSTFALADGTMIPRDIASNCLLAGPGGVQAPFHLVGMRVADGVVRLLWFGGAVFETSLVAGRLLMGCDRVGFLSSDKICSMALAPKMATIPAGALKLRVDCCHERPARLRSVGSTNPLKLEGSPLGLSRMDSDGRLDFLHDGVSPEARADGAAAVKSHVASVDGASGHALLQHKRGSALRVLTSNNGLLVATTDAFGKGGRLA
jgi:hypothetical protein